MIIMNVKLDNIYSFNDFELNFSYPKKIVNSTIEYEYLSEKPNFRYKRLNILMGTNATGKTTFGKSLVGIFNFISKKEISNLENIHNNREKPLLFSLEYVSNDLENLYKIDCEFNDKNNIKLEIYSSKINKNDTYEKCKLKLKKISVDNLNYYENLNRIIFGGWFFTFPEINITHNVNLKIFNDVLKSLDNSIVEVKKISEAVDSYVIKFRNRDVVVQNNKVIDNSTLSSGTESGINIASLISSIYTNDFGFYYCDEKFSYINSDIEISILNLMIELLHKDTQLFFTTHNLEILDMNIPFHSFTFFSKQRDIKIIHPEKYIKKNNISLKNAVKNQVFDFAPDLYLIEKLGDELVNEK